MSDTEINQMSEAEIKNLTDEQIWKGDTLNRQADAQFLMDFLVKRIERKKAQYAVEQKDEIPGLNELLPSNKKPTSYVLNIDSQWGGGKSFFLERMALHLKRDGYLVATINAWQDDHTDDPLVATMSEIENTLDIYLKENAPLKLDWNKLKANAGVIAKSAMIQFARHQIENRAGAQVLETIDSGLKGAYEGLDAARNMMDTFRDEKKAVEDFKAQLNNFLTKLDVSGATKLPFFIFVDEMDRCRPLYAIALLERVKHLFSIDNVIFVFATDTEQLSHSIRSVYGNSFDGRRYLHRFFDRTFRFPAPSIRDFVGALGHMYNFSSFSLALEGGGDANEFFVQFFEDLKLPLRDIEQCLDILHSVLVGWDTRYPPVHAIVILPLIVVFQNGLELGLNEDLSKRVLEVLKEKTSVKMNWEIAYYDRLQRAAGSVGWWDYFEAYIEMGQKSEIELTEFLTDQKVPVWKMNCGEHLLREYFHIGSLRHTTPSCHPSIDQYFNAISSAGRLVAL